MAFDAREILEDERIAGNSERPIMNASKGLAEALDKMSSLIAALEGRVEPIRSRNRMEQDSDANVKAQRPKDPPAISPLAHDLVSYTHQIQRFGRRIGRVLEEIEI